MSDPEGPAPPPGQLCLPSQGSAALYFAGKQAKPHLPVGAWYCHSGGWVCLPDGSFPWTQPGSGGLARHPCFPQALTRPCRCAFWLPQPPSPTLFSVPVKHKVAGRGMGAGTCLLSWVFTRRWRPLRVAGAAGTGPQGLEPQGAVGVGWVVTDRKHRGRARALYSAHMGSFPTRVVL